MARYISQQFCHAIISTLHNKHNTACKTNDMIQVVKRDGLSYLSDPTVREKRLLISPDRSVPHQSFEYKGQKLYIGITVHLPTL